MRAQCLLPDGPNYRRADFLSGLRAAGYDVQQRVARPGPGDVLVIWNRPARHEMEARRFEQAGAAVLVCENGYLGKQWRGEKWFAIAEGHHAGAGRFPAGSRDRWDRWRVDAAPWRAGGSEVVVLAQRGIGEPGVASPPGWADRVARELGGRVRPHPGADAPPIALADDLAEAMCVVTWHSGAALQALLLGVPVFHGFSDWIGAGAGRPIAHWKLGPKRDDGARLAMFRRMAWAMWTAGEVRAGVPFVTLKETS